MSKSNDFAKSDVRPRGGYDWQVFETLWFAFRPYLWAVVLSCLCGLLGRGLLLSNANLIGLWVDSLCPRFSNDCPERTGFTAGWESHDFLIVLAVFVALGFLTTLIFRIVFSRMSAQAVSQLYDETTMRTSRFPMRFFDTTPVGRIVTRFSSDYGNVFRLFGGPLAEFLSILFDLVCMIALASLASPYFVPLILLFMVFHLLIYRRNRHILRENRRELSASRSPSVAHFAETAQGASTIRAFNREKSFHSRFNHLDQYYLNKKWKTVRSVMLFSWQNNLLTALMLLCTGLFSWYLLQRGLVSIGSIGVAFGFITLSGTTVLMFFEWLAQVEEALIGVERMNTFLRHPIEPGSRLPQRARFPTGHPVARPGESSGPAVQGPSAEVQVANLRFRYFEDQKWVLQDFSLTVSPGEKIGIIGRTGSGKSTLAQLLFHLYPLNEGRISINGLEADLSTDSTAASAPGFTGGGNNGAGQRISLDQFRGCFSYISQDPVLFRGNLRENLDFAGKKSDEELYQALRVVGLVDWARPPFLDMPIEERGRNVSFGEKQLICLARALLQSAPIVIMDEATSSVDPQSEEIMVQATERFFAGRTQIIIAHRLSTLESCDRIVWLQNGKIWADGPPGKILADFKKSNLSVI